MGTKLATLRHILLLISNIHEHAWDQSNFTKCMWGWWQICSSKCMRGSLQICSSKCMRGSLQICSNKCMRGSWQICSSKCMRGSLQICSSKCMRGSWQICCTNRGGHGSWVPESTPAGFCGFLDPDFKIRLKRRILFSAVAGICVVFINVISLVKPLLNFGCNDGCRSQILKLEKFPDPD